MSQDIAHVCRDHGDPGDPNDWAILAAEEIERLRKQIAHAQSTAVTNLRWSLVNRLHQEANAWAELEAAEAHPEHGNPTKAAGFHGGYIGLLLAARIVDASPAGEETREAPRP